MKKYGFVYLWYDKKKKMYYVGSHWGTEDDGYVCSSRWMMKAYKRRPDDFKRRILKRVYTNQLELLDEEQKIFDKISPHESGAKYYNLSLHAKQRWHHKENRKSIHEKLISSKQTPEFKKKMSENNFWKGKDRSGSKNPMFGKKHTDEAKRKISEKNKGKQSRLGKKHTDETKQKMSESATGRPSPRKGLKVSEEQLINIKISQRNRDNSNYVKYEYEIITPDGECLRTNNLKQFCLNRGDVSVGNLSRVVNGHSKQTKGYSGRIISSLRE